MGSKKRPPVFYELPVQKRRSQPHPGSEVSGGEGPQSPAITIELVNVSRQVLADCTVGDALQLELNARPIRATTTFGPTLGFVRAADEGRVLANGSRAGTLVECEPQCVVAIS